MFPSYKLLIATFFLGPGIKLALYISSVYLQYYLLFDPGADQSRSDASCSR